MLESLNAFLSGKVLIVLIVGLGSYFTLRSRFVQIRHFPHMFAVFRDSVRKNAGQISSFQALMLSLAGRVGAGNIAGVGLAVTLGGPGAVFWMWLTALVGMATSFFECSLGQLYKRQAPLKNWTTPGTFTESIIKRAGFKWVTRAYGLMHLSV